MHNNTIDDDNKKIAIYVQSFEASSPQPLAQALWVEELKESQPKAKP